MKDLNDKNINSNRKSFVSRRVFCVLLLILAVMLFAGIFLYGTRAKDACLDRHSLINPRYACGSDIVVNKGEYRAFWNEINSYVAEKISAGEATDISVYFRDLEDGPIMSINERQDFIPASLLKLPLAVAYYSMEEEMGEALDTYIKYGEIAGVPGQNFKPQNSIVRGQRYSVRELIKYMIVYSDNAASELLFEHLNSTGRGNLLSELYRNLGIIDAGTNLELGAVNAKGYASIFRQLYNASYLSTKHSQELLSLLAQSDFRQGLVAGVPGGTRVAHKFGERFLDDGRKQLHDCGIVYYPNNPYVVCVMTQGSDFAALLNIIQYISREVYDEFNSRRL